MIWVSHSKRQVDEKGSDSKPDSKVMGLCHKLGHKLGACSLVKETWRDTCRHLLGAKDARKSCG